MVLKEKDNVGQNSKTKKKKEKKKKKKETRVAGSLYFFGLFSREIRLLSCFCLRVE